MTREVRTSLVLKPGLICPFYINGTVWTDECSPASCYLESSLVKDTELTRCIMLKTVLHILTVLASSYAIVPERLSRSDVSAFLSGHNDLRLSLGLQGLIWNSTLATFAENHGSRCLWRHSRSKYGENLYVSSPRKIDNEEIALHAIELWAAEVENVDPEWACIFVSEGTCGHYSQLVWRNTKHVGCAVVHCSGFMANYVVCEYWPPGNFYKQIPY